LHTSEINYFFIENIDTSVKNISLIIKGVEFMVIKENNEENTTLQIKNLQKYC